MAALDFPNAPTVGQIATLTNGFTYQWDGTVWIPAGTAPGQVAGGDLTGTYPNPTIAPGVVGWAKLAGLVHAYVYSSGQSLANGANVTLLFPSVVDNVGGLYSGAATDRFTIPTTGFYLIGATTLFDVAAGGTRRILYVFIDGVSDAGNEVQPASQHYVSVTVGLALNANQVVQAKAYQDSGATLGVLTPTSLWAVRVS